MTRDQKPSDGCSSLRRLTAAAIGLAFAMVASGGSSAAEQSAAASGLVVERTTEGNTTHVRNVAGSIWPGAARLVEELSIGVLEGDDPYMFGRVGSVWATDERIYVVDSQAPALRAYDHEGNYLHDLGRSGQGPGEYESPGNVLTTPIGTVLLQDVRSDRISFYAPDGELLRTWTPNERYVSGMFVLDDGTVLVRRADPPEERAEGDFAWNPRYGVAELLDDNQLAEPRYPPDFGYEEKMLVVEAGGGVMAMSGTFLFNLTLPWSVSPDGSLVAGLPDRYRFEIHSPQGLVTVVERYWEPVPVPAEHAAYAIKLIEAQFRDVFPDYTYDGDPPRQTKPAYDRLDAARDGRIWVYRVGESEQPENCVDPSENVREAFQRPCWRDRRIIDVFAPDGDYLGELLRPEGLSFRAVFVAGDAYFAAVEDEDGLVMVKKFRIEIPGDA